MRVDLKGTLFKSKNSIVRGARNAVIDPKNSSNEDQDERNFGHNEPSDERFSRRTKGLYNGNLANFAIRNAKTWPIRYILERIQLTRGTDSIICAALQA